MRIGGGLVLVLAGWLLAGPEPEQSHAQSNRAGDTVFGGASISNETRRSRSGRVTTRDVDVRSESSYRGRGRASGSHRYRRTETYRNPTQQWIGTPRTQRCVRSPGAISCR